MTRLFNRKSEKEKRRYLRKNSTEAEDIIWKYVRKKQINGERILRQFSVREFVIDFYCPILKLGIEIDGDLHFENEETIDYDKAREDYLNSLGIEIIRFQNEEVYNHSEEVIQKIKNKFKEKRNNISPETKES